MTMATWELQNQYKSHEVRSSASLAS